MLKYLARYMTGGPISDRRLVRHEHGHVTFRARKGTKTGGSEETADVRLPGSEFVRRWAMHILPKGYTKTRRFGGYSNCHRKRYMTACQELLSIGKPDPETLPANPIDAPIDEGTREHRCPECESPLNRTLLTETMLTSTSRTERPGWRTVMSGPQRPNWYDDG